STTTCLRAAAVKPGWKSSNVDTQTYIFLNDVVHQPVTPSGYPESWSFYTADYQMDPDVVNDPVYGPLLNDALLSLPTMSIVTDQDNLFDSTTGIYANSTRDGVAWERPASMEYFTPDGTKQYQINCGLRIQGGYFRNHSASRKHSFRLLFKGIYGASKMEFPIFASDKHAATSFDN
ncbi:MAG: hypothetical protein K9M57_05885, partial [Phycisphaerae bacterium]|nr:hypothetical protein [Phycisphaerae bacterium]